MRIAIVSRIYRPEPSAASLFLGAVADESTAEGHQVEVCTATPPKDTPVVPRGERVRTFPVLRDKQGYVRGYVPYMSFDIPLFFRLLFLPRPDVVLVEPPPTTGAVVRLVCGLRRIPYVYDAADIWSDAAQLEPVSPWVVRALRGVERFALRGASHVITVSTGVEERLRELGVRTPVTVTGFGADTEEFPVTVAETADEEQVFVYAGSYSPYHGADMLVDGFARFNETRPGYTLRFIGNGASRPEVEARAEALGISAQVEYLDPMPPAELLPHLARSVASLATIKPDTIYSYSYASKAFSSLAAGCPVLFAGPGPTIDLLENANRHVRAGAACDYDAESIASAMESLASERPTPEQRRALGEWSAKEHSLQAVARRITEVLRRAARPRRIRRTQ